MLPQGKDSAPKQLPKQAQRARSSVKSPPQASRKRKAQQEIHTTTSTGSRTTGGNSSPRRDMSGQVGQASRHNRLKSLGNRRQEAARPDSTTPSIVGVVDPQHIQQQSCSVLNAQQATGSLPLPASTLEAHVSGIPHTQLVLNTMRQLSRTLSSEPQAAASAQASAQQSMPALTPTAAAPFSAASAAPAQPEGSQQTERECTHLSVSAGPSPVLQPFLKATVDSEQPCQGSSVHIADPAEDQQSQATFGRAAKTPGGQAMAELASVSPNGKHPVQTGKAGEGQAEGQSAEQGEGQADRQSQKQRVTSPEEKEARPMADMQTGSALQQLILRAQKLKEQLDSHAARRHDR